jgi:hypothetical protein
VDIDEVAKERPAMPADPEALAAGWGEVDHDRRAALGPVKGASPPPAEMVTFGSPGRTSGRVRTAGYVDIDEAAKERPAMPTDPEALAAGWGELATIAGRRWAL